MSYESLRNSYSVGTELLFYPFAIGTIGSTPCWNAVVAVYSSEGCSSLGAPLQTSLSFLFQLLLVALVNLRDRSVGAMKA